MRCLFLLLFFGFLQSCALVPKFQTVVNCEGVLKYGQKQGQWICRDPATGIMTMKADFADGKKDGRVELFYPTGETQSISHWKHGLYDGNFKSYFKNGQREFEMYFTNGIKSEWWYEWNEKGDLVDD